MKIGRKLAEKLAEKLTCKFWFRVYLKIKFYLIIVLSVAEERRSIKKKGNFGKIQKAIFLVERFSKKAKQRLAAKVDFGRISIQI